MLAMDVNDNACCLNARVVLAFFASMLAPTGIFTGHKSFQIPPLIPIPQPHMVRLRDARRFAHCLNASVGALHPPCCTRAPADGVNKGEQ